LQSSAAKLDEIYQHISARRKDKEMRQGAIGLCRRRLLDEDQILSILRSRVLSMVSIAVASGE
jgi:hypothetical protein